MNWIKVSEKIPAAHKPQFGLFRTSYGELRPTIFCRRGTKKDPIFQGWWDLDIYQIEYWAKIELPE